MRIMVFVSLATLPTRAWKPLVTVGVKAPDSEGLRAPAALVVKCMEKLKEVESND
jgi:hypothetical protein